MVNTDWLTIEDHSGGIAIQDLYTLQEYLLELPSGVRSSQGTDRTFTLRVGLRNRFRHIDILVEKEHRRKKFSRRSIIYPFLFPWRKPNQSQTYVTIVGEESISYQVLPQFFTYIHSIDSIPRMENVMWREIATSTNPFGGIEKLTLTDFSRSNAGEYEIENQVVYDPHQRVKLGVLSQK